MLFNLFGTKAQAQVTKITPAKINRNTHTPDIAVLQLKEAHLYFAYHTVNNSDPRFVEMGTTQEHFQLWKHTKNQLTYPIATPPLPAFSRFPTLPIRGRLLLVPTEELIALDAAAHNGVEFTRRKIAVNVPSFVNTKERDLFSYLHSGTAIKGETVRIPEGAQVKAWIHEGVPGYWMNHLDGGYEYSKVRHFDPEDRRPATRPHRAFTRKPYYMFTKMELNGD